MFKCLNCEREVPEANREIHENFCLRNNVKCAECGEVIRRGEEETHSKAKHVPIPCALCSQLIKPTELSKHSSEECPRRQKLCSFCKMPIEAQELSKHEEFCGSKTAPCELCGRPIQNRNMEEHLISGCNFPQQQQRHQQNQWTPQPNNTVIIEDDEDIDIQERDLDVLRRTTLSQRPHLTANTVDLTFEKQLREARRISLLATNSPTSPHSSVSTTSIPAQQQRKQQQQQQQRIQTKRERKQQSQPLIPIPIIITSSTSNNSTTTTTAANSNLQKQVVSPIRSPPRQRQAVHKSPTSPTILVQPSPRTSQMPTKCPWCATSCVDFEQVQLHMLTTCPLKSMHVQANSPQSTFQQLTRSSPFSTPSRVVNSFRVENSTSTSSPTGSSFSNSKSRAPKPLSEQQRTEENRPIAVNGHNSSSPSRMKQQNRSNKPPHFAQQLHR